MYARGIFTWLHHICAKLLPFWMNKAKVFPVSLLITSYNAYAITTFSKGICCKSFLIFLSPWNIQISIFYPLHASLQPIQCMNKFSNYINKYTKAAHFDNWAVVKAITKYMYKVPYMTNITIARRLGRAARVPLWTRSVPSCLLQLPPKEDYNASWGHWQSGDQPISEPEIGKERL